MKLFNGDLSPYATRVRIQIRLKNLDIDIVPPPAPLRTPEIRQEFILGKIPVLELDDGSYMPDSMVIMEYLEDIFPETPLRPEGARERADMNLLIRYSDTYFAPALFPLFRALSAMPDDDGKGALMTTFKAEVATLDRLLGAMPSYKDRPINIGDIALAPNLFFGVLLAPIFGETKLLEGFDNIQSWWAHVTENEEIKRGIDEIDIAFKAFAKR